jgi:hypothetical protein
MTQRLAHSSRNRLAYAGAAVGPIITARCRHEHVEQAEALVAKMTHGEKAQLLQHVARGLGDAFHIR